MRSRFAAPLTFRNFTHPRCCVKGFVADAAAGLLAPAALHNKKDFLVRIFASARVLRWHPVCIIRMAPAGEMKSILWMGGRCVGVCVSMCGICTKNQTPEYRAGGGKKHARASTRGRLRSQKSENVRGRFFFSCILHSHTHTRDIVNIYTACV